MGFITDETRQSAKSMLEERKAEEASEIERFCSQENLDELVCLVAGFVRQDYLERSGQLPISCVYAKFGPDGKERFGITDHVVAKYDQGPKQRLLDALQMEEPSTSAVIMNAALGYFTVTFNPPLS